MAARRTAGSIRDSDARRAGRPVGEELRLPIAADVDVVEARQQGRALAAVAGFSSGEQTVIAAAISEIARNILMYAKKGEITLSLVQNGDRQGVEIGRASCRERV